MITNAIINEILKTHAAIGVPLPVEKIQRIVETHYDLDDQDWAPDPSEIERGSKYPSWKRKVQAVLHVLKEKHKVEHDADRSEYVFSATSFS